MTSVDVQTITLPGVDDDTHRTINRLLKQLQDRTPDNLTRAAYYDGKHAIRQLGPIIPPQYYRLGITIGWSGKAVDTLADRCNLDGFVWPGEDLDSIGYADLVEDNFLFARVNAALVSSLIYGPAFGIVSTGGPGEPASLIHFKDALSATGDMNERTWRLDNLFSVIARDPETNLVTEFALYLDGRTISAQRERGAWVWSEQRHTFGVPAEALVYQPRIGRPWGYSRLTPTIMSYHRSAVRSLIRTEGHLDVYAWPDMWMLGADETAFRNPDGSIKPVWQVRLGRIKGIPDDEEADPALARADIKQFPGSSPDSHMKAIELYAGLFAGEAAIPIDDLGVSNRANPTSAEAYIASRDPLIARAERATDDWSPPLRRLVIKALAMRNGKGIPAAFKTIDARWRSPIYLSRAAAADAGSKQLAAAPWLAETEVGLELLGLTDQQIARAMSEKRKAQGVRTVLDAVNTARANAAAPVA